MLPTLRNDLGPGLYLGGWVLSYLHSTGNQGDFPIGNIVDPETPAVNAREVIEQTIGLEYGPIVHVSLAHQEHNKVVVLDSMPTGHMLLNCDAVIFPKRWRIGVETLLGDCTCSIVASADYIGFMHIGRPELFGGLISRFSESWVEVDENQSASVHIGPGICGKHYELPDLSAVAGTQLEVYKTVTEWGTQGYDMYQAITAQFRGLGFPHVLEFPSDVHCPFCARQQSVCSSWASDQYFRVKGMDPSRPFSPRDCAFLRRKG